MKTGNLFGRMLALALIIGVVYGAREIARGRFDCTTGGGGCCMIGEHGEADHDHDRAAGAKAEPAANSAVDSDEDDAKIEAKAPVVPPKAAE